MSRVSLWAAIAAGALGCSPVVGAECADGYAECQGRCVDLYSDTEHCGACGSACPTGSYCSLGECTGAQREDAGGDAGQMRSGPTGRRFLGERAKIAPAVSLEFHMLAQMIDRLQRVAEDALVDR